MIIFLILFFIFYMNLIQINQLILIHNKIYKYLHFYCLFVVCLHLRLTSHKFLFIINHCSLFVIHHEQLVLRLVESLWLFFFLFNSLLIRVLFLLWLFNLLILLTQKPLLTCKLILNLFLSNLFMFKIKLFLPNIKVLNRDWCKSSKLWSLKYLINLLLYFEIGLICSTLY